MVIAVELVVLVPCDRRLIPCLEVEFHLRRFQLGDQRGEGRAGTRMHTSAESSPASMVNSSRTLFIFIIINVYILCF